MNVVEGKTQSGFKYKVDERALKDARMWELIDASKDGGDTSSVRVPAMLLGEKGKEDLYNFVQDEDGYVAIGEVNKIIGEILEDAATKSSTVKN